ncbi:uracil-DNA glycosylase [Oscillospiraceae bacterium OttesenSCG-928-F05]|nr:uracil-DNA glycosylase [Oscillospiraceae bacterium OttesenSCG-928-F05]
MPSWEELKESCLACRKCGLEATRTNVVFGVGNPEAEVLFIGEGPGEQEDLRGEPFVGRAGKLLDDMLTIIGLDRTKIYIANIVKCRPPGNRDPKTEEQEACIPWLRTQTSLIQPKLIVCLGRIAAQKIIKPDYRITAEHGQWVSRGKYKLTAFFHPAALLRDPRKKPEAFEDLYGLRDQILECCERTALN